MLTTLITDVIGGAPVGWEFVPYMLAGVTYLIGLFLLVWVLSIPMSFLRGRSGGGL